MFKSRYQTLLLVCLSIATFEVSAMGLFDFLKVCLFSEVNGVVTLEGRPVAGAELVRTAKIGEKTHVDRTTTDENGRFSFPEMYAHSLNKIAPVEPFIAQKITILADSREFLAWSGNKRNYDLDGEIYRPLKFNCEITNKDELLEFDKSISISIYHGICRQE
jgi:hypothetical protein